MNDLLIYIDRANRYVCAVNLQDYDDRNRPIQTVPQLLEMGFSEANVVVVDLTEDSEVVIEKDITLTEEMGAVIPISFTAEDSAACIQGHNYLLEVNVKGNELEPECVNQANLLAKITYKKYTEPEA